MKRLTIKMVVALLFLPGASLLLSAEESVQDMLFRAVRRSNVAAAKRALEAGADINGQTLTTGTTALMTAAQDGDLNLVRFLLRQGADVNERDIGNRTALMFAAKKGYTAVARELIQYGADVNASIIRINETPLMMAAFAGRAPMVALLLANGADLNAKDYQEKTALDVAREQGNSASAQAIEDFIAKKRAERREEVSQAIQKARPEVYPVITEEIAEFEIGK